MLGKIKVGAILRVPKNAKGIVIFAHGSGSSRLSPRNNFVAENLAEDGLASLLLDLLTIEEETDRGNVFDINLLAERLVLATEFILKQLELKNLPIGYFGASTGAAAALKAAAIIGLKIKAVVSRGGRPDLALDVLPNVLAPTLLIVGSLDTEVIEMNKAAFKELNSIKKMILIEGAEHLFENPGELEEVAKEAIEWYLKYLK